MLCGVLAFFIIAGIFFFSRKRQHQKKSEAQATPAAALTAESGSDAAEREGPSKEDAWEQLLQEQMLRVRATNEASTAEFGAGSARPVQRRPPAAAAWLRRCPHSHICTTSLAARLLILNAQQLSLQEDVSRSSQCQSA